MEIFKNDKREIENEVDDVIQNINRKKIDDDKTEIKDKAGRLQEDEDRPRITRRPGRPIFGGSTGSGGPSENPYEYPQFTENPYMIMPGSYDQFTESPNNRDMRFEPYNL